MARFLRSPHAHARIRSIDTRKAESLPGVKAVVTARDLPESGDRIVDLGEGQTPLKYIRGNVLASDKALYRGHAIAGVAATSPHIAAEAVKLIEVDYEVLPCVLTAPDAMRDGAPILDDNLKTEEFGQKTDQPSNVAAHIRHELGNIEQGFSQADIIVEREFNTATVHQGYIEPHNATALWNQRWASPDLVQHSGRFHRARRDRVRSGPAGFAGARLRRRKSAADSAGRSRCTSSRWPRCCPGKRDGRSRWSCHAKTYSREPVPLRVPLYGSR